MAILYKLYLDETGTPNPHVEGFPYFVLSGLLVREDQSEQLKIAADRVKFKYWGNSFRNIVFHSREIGRRENDFSILKDHAIEQSFYKDLYYFLEMNGVKCIIVAVDKMRAKALNWDIAEVYQKSTDEMLKFFINFLHTKSSTGRVIIESAGTTKDIAFYKNYIYYLANGMYTLSISSKQMKKILTSISFVSKNNFDIETQIADLLAYPAGHICLVNEGKKRIVPNSYEEKLCQTLQRKTISLNNQSSFVTLPSLTELPPSPPPVATLP